MKITEIKKIENCLEGKNVWEIFFDIEVGQQLVAKLGIGGKVIVHPFEPKAFFTIIHRGKYTIKGAFGNRHARLILPDNVDNFQEIFIKIEDVE